MGGLYLHIPFCQSKCGYCAFYSLVGHESYIGDFAGAIVNELDERLSEMALPVDTIYIGGGTPSLLAPEVFFGLADSLKSRACAAGRESIREFTVEANPDDVDETIADIWASSGVNRVSMGVQSFSDKELKIIGRRHNAASARRSYDVLRNRFGNVSLDVIFGLPGQTFESWKATVDEVIRLSPEHVSAYSLMFEERSRFSAMLEAGEIMDVGEDVSSRMFQYLAEAMCSAGYEHYEISNFARPGFRSLHNSSYWKGLPYLGLGPGASSYDGKRTRRTNPSDLKAYLHRFGHSGAYPSKALFYEEECLSDEELVEEYLLTRLRIAEGICLDDYRNRFGEKEADRLFMKASGLSRLNGDVLAVNKHNIALTERGFFVSDDIIVELMP